LEKTKIAKKKSYIDFGLYAAITDTNINSIGNMSKLVSGFKIFLGSTTNSLQLSEYNIGKAFYQVNLSRTITLIHAENEQCLRKYKGIAYNLKEHLQQRPSECEEISIEHILKNCNDISSKIHICHLSSCEGLELLKKRPNNVSVGVTPHHIFFDINRVKSNETLYKVIPPIRSSLDRETLWHGIKNGDIDILESDHAPHSLEEKEVDFDKAPSGVPSVETMYPLFLAEVKKEHMSFARLISLLCERPAELMDIPKGKLEVGRDADFVVIDYKKIVKIKADILHSKCGWTPFEGMDAIFPSYVFSRGEKLIEDHEMVGRQGFGKFVGE
jgi:dihydroorotase